MLKVFTKTKAFSLIDGAYKDNYYFKTACQNRWDDKCAHRQGIIEFDESLNDFIRDHEIESIKLIMHRRDSFHGLNGRVKPDLQNFVYSGEGADRGGWTEMLIDPDCYDRLTSLVLGTGKTGETFAIWDTAELHVVYTEK